MPDAYLLSEDDRRVLREIVFRYKNDSINSRNITPPDLVEHQAPEVYVAQAPGGGIPAMSGSVPGSATCQFFDPSQDSAVAVPGLSRLVLNLSGSALDPSTYFPVKRDKYGNWLADLAGSGGGGAILDGLRWSKTGTTAYLFTYGTVGIYYDQSDFTFGTSFASPSFPTSQFVPTVSGYYLCGFQVGFKPTVLGGAAAWDYVLADMDINGTSIGLQIIPIPNSVALTGTESAIWLNLSQLVFLDGTGGSGGTLSLQLQSSCDGTIQAGATFNAVKVD